MNKLFVPLSFLFIVGCTGAAQKTEYTENSDFKVDFLFEYDECKVYRFYDGRNRYFTNCKGSTQWSESCGKNCTRDSGVQGGK